MLNVVGDVLAQVMQEDAPQIREVDVLLVGAGISGVGLAHHLKDHCEGKSFAILEAKDHFGGTWYTHTYPGIRSDSDLYTFGYRFKPWTGVPIAEASAILDYMEDVITEDDLAGKIFYGRKVTKACWSSEDEAWTVSVANGETGETEEWRANFLLMCQGYYDHDNPYTPDWEGMDDFNGQIIHPQLWPDDLDYKDKKVVVIGSGATAATLIPNMADDCEHLTMLQRSPTYFWTGENRNELADQLGALDIPEEWTHEIVRQSVLAQHKAVHELAMEHPDLIKQELLNVLRGELGDDIVNEHFTPSYRPWQQRLAYVPDGDLFKAVKSGKVDIVTDHIDRFTEKGILLKSGKELEADIIVTATGFNLLFLGGIPFEVDGDPVEFSDRYTYRGLMVSDVPNMLHVFGYLRTSWTMRVDLIGDYVCRLLNHMAANDLASVTPTPSDDDRDLTPGPWISDDDFNPGYMLRGRDQMPKNGGREPWTYVGDYYQEKTLMPAYSLEDPALVYQPTAASLKAFSAG